LICFDCIAYEIPELWIEETLYGEKPVIQTVGSNMEYLKLKQKLYLTKEIPGTRLLPAEVQFSEQDSEQDNVTTSSGYACQDRTIERNPVDMRNASLAISRLNRSFAIQLINAGDEADIGYQYETRFLKASNRPGLHCSSARFAPLPQSHRPGSMEYKDDNPYTAGGRSASSGNRVDYGHL